MTSITARTRAFITAGIVLATAVTLTACGGSSVTAGSTGSSSSASESAAPGQSPTGTPATGDHNSADVSFTVGMIPHHAQAVEMSEMLLGKSGIDPEVVTLAKAIKGAQGPEIEQMRGWLAGWGEPVPASGGTSNDMGGMAGMDHGNNGMMSDADMTALENADGAEAQKLFLSGMVVHHNGAIAMAQMELSSGQNADAKKLANAVITAQQGEIETMTALLKK